jgi:hypothetical protein
VLTLELGEDFVGGLGPGKRLAVLVPGGTHPGVLVGGVVVADHMQLPARPGGGHLLEERQRLLMAVARLALVQDVPGGDLQGGEQGGGPVPD